MTGVRGESGQALGGENQPSRSFFSASGFSEVCTTENLVEIRHRFTAPTRRDPPSYMNSIDCEILSLIQNDARAAHATVGERLGLTAPAVHARIKRLERDGIIRGYLTAIDPIAVNQTLLVFVRVTTNSKRGDEDKFENFVRHQANILECHDISGEDSYLLKIRVESPASLRQLLYRIRDFPGVERTVTSISLCTIKELRGPPLTTPVSESESSVQIAQR